MALSLVSVSAAAGVLGYKRRENMSTRSLYTQDAALPGESKKERKEFHDHEMMIHVMVLNFIAKQV